MVSGPVRISVVVCTHNPKRHCLERALESLWQQSLRVDRWELLLVDNGSDAPVAGYCDLSWHPRARHVREPQPGLLAARLRGIDETDGALLVFVDDDNVLEASFLEEALDLSQRYPLLGAFGAGRLEPEFEIPPPAEIGPRVGLLAVRSVPESRWSNNPKDADCVPWGAGLCVTREVADAYRHVIDGLGPDVSTVMGRRGSALFSGEDEIFSWISASLGLGFGIFPSLTLVHLISADRLTRRYFLKLIHDHSFSHGIRQYMLTGVAPRHVDGFTAAHLLLHGIRNGLFSMQCQWASARGEADAATFIVERSLQPIRLRDLVDVRRPTDLHGTMARLTSS